MKTTTLIAFGIVFACGIFATVFALTGFNALLFLCGHNPIVYRSVLSLAGVAALWLLYWLIAFRPTRYLS